MAAESSVTVAIVTYNRGSVLVETIGSVRNLDPAPAAIIVVDQTELHPDAVQEALTELDRSGVIRWIRTSPPSIPASMNRALLETSTEITLFIDDDAEPDAGLVGAHRQAYKNAAVWAAAGRITDVVSGPRIRRRRDTAFVPDLEFDFTSGRSGFVQNVMAGNLSVRRERALSIGGFDEQFIGAAYRFETDFARRLIAAGGKIWFAAEAKVRHLKMQQGGIRSFGDHLISANPAHCVGDYYFAWRHAEGWNRLRYVSRRLGGSVVTRFHLRHPWWIPPKLVGEIRGLLLGRRLARQGPKLLTR